MKLNITYRKHESYIGSVFSFGAGVQSTAILLMIVYEPERILKAMGHLPDHIIFADTGAESKEALENLERCRQLTQIYRVKNWENNAYSKNGSGAVPAFFLNGGFSSRSCTHKWKITPIQKAIKKLYPKKSPKTPVGLWLGISTDEITRMKENQLKSVENLFPLIDMGLSRQDCYRILKKYNWAASKSACYFCPYQGKRWAENPEIDKAIAYEKLLQKESKYRETPYLHRSCQPLEEVVDFMSRQYNLFSFDDECDGHCGL